MAVSDKGGANMYKVVVVGTDGSDRASVAVTHAFELAKLSGGKVHADPGGPPRREGRIRGLSGAQLEIDKRRVMAEQSATNLLAEAQREVWTWRCTTGPEKTSQTPSSRPAGTRRGPHSRRNRGMNSVAHFVLGSVPNKVSHRCPCNLLIVNTEPD